MRTLVHLSDLHFGRIDPLLLDPLAAAVDRARARRRRRLRRPHPARAAGAVPRGARLPRQRCRARRSWCRATTTCRCTTCCARFLAPLGDYRRYIDADPCPIFIDDEIAVVGINTARSLTFKGGRINEEQVAPMRQRFAALPDAVHRDRRHPPSVRPARRTRDEDDLVGRAAMAMQAFAECGVDLLLSGHLHRTHSGSTALRYEIAGYAALVVQAGTATSTRGRGEANSFNVLRDRAAADQRRRLELATANACLRTRRQRAFPPWRGGMGTRLATPVQAPQHFLYFLPLPHGHGALRSGVSTRRIGSRGVSASMRWWCRSASMPGRLAMISSRSR